MLRNKFHKKEKVIKTHESLKMIEKKAHEANKKASKEKMHERLEKIRKFIISERDYMIFLAMLLVVSVLFEPVGFSKTLPLIIIVPFILGTFYSAKKKVFYHTIIAMLILATVHRDAVYAAFVIILGSFCTFASIYLAKYLDQVKNYNIFKKITSGIIAGALVFLSISLYLSRYGSPFNYMKAQDAIMKFATENYGDEILYNGLTYNFNTKLYEAEYLYKEDYKVSMKFGYNDVNGKIKDGYKAYLKEKYNNEISSALKVLIAESNIEKLENIFLVDITFDESMNLKPTQNFDFKTPINVLVKLKDADLDEKVEDETLIASELNVESEVILENNTKVELTNDDLYFIKNQLERITKNISKLKVQILDSKNELVKTLDVSYENGIVTNEMVVEKAKESKETIENATLEN